MSDRDDRLVDVFLEDLGTAPVPAGLTGRVAQRAREERQMGGRGVGRWLALAAAGIGAIGLAGLAFVVAGPKPLPSTGVVPSASASAVASASPSSEATARVTPAPSNLIASLPPSPSSGPAESVTERLLLSEGGASPLPALVVDYSQRVTAAVGVASPGTPTADVELIRGGGPNKLIVSWTGFACDQYAEIVLDQVGSSLTVGTHKPSGGCDLVGTDRAVELTFSGPIDPATLGAKYEPGVLQLGWLRPVALWFSDTKHGYVAGRGGDPAGPGPAVLLETSDAAQTLDATVIGWGEVTSMGALLGPDVVERPVVGISCETEVVAPDPLCTPGLFRHDPGGWVRIRKSGPLGLATRDNTLVVWERGEVPATQSMPYPPVVISLSRDGGLHWTSVANPCELMPKEMTSATFDQTNRLVVVCQGDAATGSAGKQVQRAANDAATSWTTMPPLPDAGGAMQVDLTPDGYGYAWGESSPLLSTTDGGATWAPGPGGPDGDVRTTIDASAFAGGGGAVIVEDPNTQTLSVEISNGRSRVGGISWPE